jgi:hypothetical protein
MAQQVDVKGFGLVEFPDNTDRLTMLNALRHKFSTMPANETGATAAPYSPTLAERAQSGIAGALTKSGLVTNPYQAQRVGRNVGYALDVLPVVGDALGGDELGRAIKQGDAGGIGFAALGAIPVAGDTLKALFRNKPNFYDDVSAKIYETSPNFVKDGRIDKDLFNDAISDAEQAVDPDIFDKWLNADWEANSIAPLSQSDYDNLTKGFKGQTIYHGSPYEFDDVDLVSDGAAFFSTNRKAAEQYADGGKIYEYTFQPENPFFIRDADMTYDMERSGVIEDLISKGYDSIVPVDGGDVVILNKSAMKKR